MLVGWVVGGLAKASQESLLGKGCSRAKGRESERVHQGNRLGIRGSNRLLDNSRQTG